jgi:hypothetical protein
VAPRYPVPITEIFSAIDTILAGSNGTLGNV